MDGVFNHLIGQNHDNDHKSDRNKFLHFNNFTMPNNMILVDVQSSEWNINSKKR